IVDAQLDHPLVLALKVVDLLERAYGVNVESGVAQPLSDLQRAGTSDQGLVQQAGLCLGVRHHCVDATTPPVVAQPFREGLGLAEARQHSLPFTELIQHRSQVESDVERLLERGLVLRQGLENTQRLIEPTPSVVRRRSRGRSQPRLPEIVNRFLTQVAPDGVMSESLALIAEAVGVECLDRFDDPRVKLPPALP